MTYIKKAKGGTEEKKIVNARIPLVTVEAINTASDMFKSSNKGMEISMSGIINQAMEEATKQCSEVLLIDLKKLSECKIKIETCMEAISSNLSPHHKKLLMKVRPDYEFTSPEQSNMYHGICEHEGNWHGLQWLKEDIASDKNKTPLTKEDLIDDSTYWIDVDYENLKLSEEISTQTLLLFSRIESNKELLKKEKKSLKFGKNKELFQKILTGLEVELLLPILDELKISDYAHLDEKLIEVKNKFIVLITEYFVELKLQQFFHTWMWVLNDREFSAVSTKIRSVFVRQGLYAYNDGRFPPAYS